MKKILNRKLFLAALVTAGLGYGAAPANADGNCDGRVSWLTGYCTYCEWGGACGACQIRGCVPKLTEDVPG